MANTRRRNWRRGILIAASLVVLLAAGIAAGSALIGDVRVWQSVALVATLAGVISLLLADLTSHWRSDPDVEAALPPQGERARQREARRDINRDGNLRSVGHSMLLFGAAALVGLYLRG